MIENSHAQDETDLYAQGMPPERDMPPLPDVPLSNSVNRDAGSASGAPPTPTRISAPQSTPALLDALATLAELGATGTDVSDPGAALGRALRVSLPLLPSAGMLAVYGRDESTSEESTTPRTLEGDAAFVLLAATPPRQPPSGARTRDHAPESGRDAQNDSGSLPRQLASGLVTRLATPPGVVEEDGVWYTALHGAHGLCGALAVRPATAGEPATVRDAADQAVVRVLRASLGGILERRARQSESRQLTEMADALAEARFAARAAAAAGEEQARAFDQVLSLAAHELRSPLTSVKGYGQLLLRQAGKLGLPERVVRSSEAIVQQSERLAEMIDELHDAARIRRGRLELAHDPVDLVAVAERVIPRLQHEYPRRQIELVREVDSAIGEWDASRVAQCVRALIDNALRFSPDAGTVWVEIRTQSREDAASGPGEAVLCVRDAGIGIPFDEREHIYEFLYRGPSAERRNLAGLGLGLFVAQNIARMLGGQLSLVWSHSDYGNDQGNDQGAKTPTGAEFCLALPLAQAPEETSE